MIRFAISLASIILTAGFLLSGYALTQVIIANFSLEGRISWIAVAQSISPFILAAGVMVAWATLQSNIRHSHEQRRREESAFFFRECKENLDDAISLLTAKLSPMDSAHGITRADFAHDLEHVAGILNDVEALSMSIAEDAFVRAYLRRRDDVRRRLYNLFRQIKINDLCQLRHGAPSDDMAARIERHNEQMREMVANETNALKRAELRERFQAKDESTPFPDGAPTWAIRTILGFFDSGAVKRENGEVTFSDAQDSRLEVIRSYIEYCRRYENHEGLLRLKSAPPKLHVAAAAAQ